MRTRDHGKGVRVVDEAVFVPELTLTLPSGFETPLNIPNACAMIALGFEASCGIMRVFPSLAILLNASIHFSATRSSTAPFPALFSPCIARPTVRRACAVASARTRAASASPRAKLTDSILRASETNIEDCLVPTRSKKGGKQLVNSTY